MSPGPTSIDAGERLVGRVVGADTPPASIASQEYITKIGAVFTHGRNKQILVGRPSPAAFSRARLTRQN